MKCRAPNARAFTLVELLVVIFIIAILVAIVVGVSTSVGRQAARERTRASMDVIRGAIDVYYEQAGDYPAEDAFTDQKPGDCPWSDRNWEAYQHIVSLYDQLNEVGFRRAQARLEQLAPDVRITVMAGTTCSNMVFADGFGKFMDYEDDAVAGKMPLLTSAGADGDFGTAEDNIRSDKR